MSTEFGSSAQQHAAIVKDQFTRQASAFAAAPELHNEALLQVIVDAASPRATDFVVDVACGPGLVALAFASRAERVEGIDATDAMLEQARLAASAFGVKNVNWTRGSVYALPFANSSVDV